MTHAKPRKKEDVADPVARFRELLIEQATLLRAEGIPVVAFRSPSLPHFARLDAALQQRAIEDVSREIQVYQDVLNEGARLRDNAALLWRSLHQLGFTPPSDIFDKIGDGDIVEIYDLRFRQIFRNLAFYDLVSYTIEEMYGCHWWELVWRDPKYTEQLLSFGNRVFSGEITRTACPGVEEHEIQETRSQERRRFRFYMKWISPLKKDGQLAGAMNVNRAALI